MGVGVGEEASERLKNNPNQSVEVAGRVELEERETEGKQAGKRQHDDDGSRVRGGDHARGDADGCTHHDLWLHVSESAYSFFLPAHSFSRVIISSPTSHSPHCPPSHKTRTAIGSRSVAGSAGVGAAATPPHCLTACSHCLRSHTQTPFVQSGLEHSRHPTSDSPTHPPTHSIGPSRFVSIQQCSGGWCLSLDRILEAHRTAEAMRIAPRVMQPRWVTVTSLSRPLRRASPAPVGCAPLSSSLAFIPRSPRLRLTHLCHQHLDSCTHLPSWCPPRVH